VAVGVATIALIVGLQRTRVGSLGLVVAVVAASAGVKALGWSEVATLSSLGVDLGNLPTPQLPLLRMVPVLIVPALSLAFVALVQGAGVAASFPNDDGTPANASRDFIGQGAANVAVGVFQGMPVGGTMSGSSLNKAAGATSRYSLFFASAFMAVITVVLGDAVGSIAMPALAGLLMVVGFRTVKPANVVSVWKTGPVQRFVMAITLVLTLVIPLQFAVVVGVGMSVLLYVIRQSNQVSIRRWHLDDDGQLIETDPPRTVTGDDVVVLQPYGSLFFAAAPVFEAALPAVTPQSTNAVVILRLRGRGDLGTTFMDVLRRYARQLDSVDSKLVIVSANERIQNQLRVTGITDVVGVQNIYPGDERVGATLKRAYADATSWVEGYRPPTDRSPGEP
jgi:SulP family sulfate permease